ncbi:cysteine desulfhydrase [Marinomonas sp.]|nr:cysteine desulfhydrase [Marinomonas sp.]MDB4837096.1 cysteine desulfhydrase [Marinomonas sp.]
MSLIHSIVLPESFRASSNQQYELNIYRGDLEHVKASGNKWHKLQYHLKQAEKQSASVIATFGGPFSNHLHAFGATIENLPFKAVAVVRGELQPQLNASLKDVIGHGVELWPTLRSDYRLAMGSDVVRTINERYDNVYWIPEGGGGELGALGCRDWAEQIDLLDNSYDAWVVSAGTGTTAAGMLAYKGVPSLHVVSALKGADEQRAEILLLARQLVINKLTEECLTGIKSNHSDSLENKLFFHANAHHGGYAKHSHELEQFIQEYAVDNRHHPLDPVYTCKSMFAIIAAMKRGEWPYSRTLFIHTGGLQGWCGHSKKKNPFLSA